MSFYTRLYDFMAGATVRSQEFDDEFNAIAAASRTTVRAVDEITADLPNAAARANKLLSFDASGNASVSNTINDSFTFGGTLSCADPAADSNVATRRWVQTLALSATIPVLPGDAGKVLGNNGSTVQWTAANTLYPSQTGNSGKFLSTDGSSVSWASPLPSATGNEGKMLAVNSAAATAWIVPQSTWANWTLITTNGGTFTVPDGVSLIRAYVFGGGGDGSSSVGGGGGGGGGCTFGTIPCKPGDVFELFGTVDPVLRKGATAYLSAKNGAAGSGGTGGAGGIAGTVGTGLGITASGAYAGGAGANGNSSNLGGGGGSSGSPLGNGFAGTTGTGQGGGGGGGWGSSGSIYCGGGVGSYAGSDGLFTGSAAVDANSRPASRDWSNAFTDPLLRMCNGVAPVLSTLSLGSEYAGNHGGAGCGGSSPRQSGAYPGGNGGLGGGGGPSRGDARAGHGGFGGGGGCCEGGANAYSGNGGIGGGGGGGVGTNKQGAGGSAGVMIFW